MTYKAIAIALLALTACEEKKGDCNSVGKPIQVVASTRSAEYRDWSGWTVLTKQGDNTFIYCRGYVLSDLEVEPGKFYSLNGFYRDKDI